MTRDAGCTSWEIIGDKLPHVTGSVFSVLPGFGSRENRAKCVGSRVTSLAQRFAQKSYPAGLHGWLHGWALFEPIEQKLISSASPTIGRRPCGRPCRSQCPAF